jgi:hypothetical protein
LVLSVIILKKYSDAHNDELSDKDNIASEIHTEAKFVPDYIGEKEKG